MRGIGMAAFLSIGFLSACNEPETPVNNMAAAKLAAALHEHDATPAAMSGSEFANTIAGNDAFEIAAASLALEKTRAAPIKLFADQMIEAHTASSARLRQAAAAASPPIAVETGLPGDLQVKLDALKALSGEAFDDRFMQTQVAAHEAALATLASYRSSGDVVSLKDFAAQENANASDHLEMARKLAR